MTYIETPKMKDINPEILSRSKKNILFLMDSMTGGGAEKALLEIFNKLDYNKYNITLILYKKLGIHLSSIPYQVTIKSIYPIGYRLFFEKIICHTPLKFIYEKYKLIKLITGVQFNTIVSYMEGPGAALHSFILNRAKHNVTWVHVDFQKNPWSKVFFKNDNYEREFYNSVDDIVFVSQGTMNFFPYKTKANKHCIYNIINNEKINYLASSCNIQKDNFTVSFIGRLVKTKKPERFLNAISILRKKGIKIDGWILGDGDEKEFLKHLAHKLEIDKHIKFLGFKKNPYPYLKATDSLIITSDAEGLPVVVQEALCIGTPIISTRCCGMDEALGNDTGIFTDFTAESIANAIESIYTDRALHESLKLKSRNRCKIFNADNVMKQIIEVIDPS